MIYLYGINTPITEEGLSQEESLHMLSICNLFPIFYIHSWMNPQIHMAMESQQSDTVVQSKPTYGSDCDCLRTLWMVTMGKCTNAKDFWAHSVWGGRSVSAWPT